MATHAIALVLGLARGFHSYIPNQASGAWEPHRDPGDVIHLPEATILIVGLGGIGAEIARLLSVFGSRLLATDVRITEAPEHVAVLRGPEALDDLLPEADIVVVTVPHTPQTQGLFSAARFAAMKPTSYFVNVGRGMVVRLDDLAAALESGEIAGAGLDVYEAEPLPPDHPLWRMPNVLLTPHTAATGPYVDERRFAVFLDNAHRFAAGRELGNVVDKASWF